MNSPADEGGAVQPKGVLFGSTSSKLKEDANKLEAYSA